MKHTTLNPDEEAQLLFNLLVTDGDDWISRRILELHYQRENASKLEKTL
jgi:hypothetical protein